MIRNSEFRFGQTPHVNIQRSGFKMSKRVKGSFNVGDIVPFYVDSDILPGDTWKAKQTFVARLATPIFPTMDDLVIDTYFFAIPYRLVWDNFQKFMGENENGAWTQTTQYETPMTKPPATTGWTKGSIGDYMGLPINNPNYVHSALPIRAYRAVYNYFFRNQNLIAPVAVLKTDNAGNSNIASTYQTLFKASRLPDYLSTCTPQPMKAPGGNVSIPLGTTAPVSIYGNGKNIGLTDANSSMLTLAKSATIYPELYKITDGNPHTIGGNASNFGSTETSTSHTMMGVHTDPTKSGLIGLADLSNATAATIIALRTAVQTAKLYERNVHSTLYPDTVYLHFGTVSPDGRQQRPEYLGGRRINVTYNQVAQTSATDNTVSPQGNVSAFSLTVDSAPVFTKSFTEHTIVLGVMVARILRHSYQQNLERQWTRRHMLDYYWPVLSSIGDQPVYNKEIYCQGDTVLNTDGNPVDDDVFGYQERWSEYKYKTSTVCGELRSTYTTPLDSWHFGDKYNSLPVLSQQWIEENGTFVKRTLAVQSHDDFIFDTVIDFTAYRPMRMVNTPGLMDHF